MNLYKIYFTVMPLIYLVSLVTGSLWYWMYWYELYWMYTIFKIQQTDYLRRRSCILFTRRKTKLPVFSNRLYLFLQIL